MDQGKVRVFDAYDELSRGAAARFLEVAQDRIANAGAFSAALSGGATPKGFFQFLSRREFATRVDWDRAHLFQVDERPVPPDHADSNFRMIREAFLESVPKAASNFHRMQAENPDLDAAARAYENELARALRPREGQWPRLDVILLGIGSDGHTASLFPQSPGLTEKVRWVVPNYVAKLGTNRLTLTYPVLNAGREVIFLVSGEEKAEIVLRAIQGPRLPDQLPCQGIEPVEGGVFWYLDKAAASRLQLREGARD
jgi:6-phosphogluconolactonase